MADLLNSFFAWLLSSGVIWYLILGAISLAFSKKSQLDHWVEKNPKAAAVAKILRSVGFDPWMFLQGLWLLFAKKLPPGAKNPIPVPQVIEQLESEPPPTPKN